MQGEERGEEVRTHHPGQQVYCTDGSITRPRIVHNQKVARKRRGGGGRGAAGRGVGRNANRGTPSRDARIRICIYPPPSVPAVDDNRLPIALLLNARDH